MKQHHSEKCPRCKKSVMVDMIDKMDGVRRVGCEHCGIWSEPSLSTFGAMIDLRKKMRNEKS